MKKTLKIFLTLLFSVAVIFSASADAAAADKDDFCGFGVSFSVDGFDYTITISYNGQGIRDSANYSAIIVEGAKRDLSDEIESL